MRVGLENKLILFTPTEGMVTVLKTSFWVGLVASFPFWGFFILRFIAPAFRANEARLIIPFLVSSLIFLTLGVLFSFFFTIPIATHYLEAFNQTLGTNLWGFSLYLDYTLLLLLANALLFELCVIMFFLVHFGVISENFLRSKRRYLIVAIFVISAILSPPDVLTQILLALPLIVFLELAIFYGRLRQKK